MAATHEEVVTLQQRQRVTIGAAGASIDRSVHCPVTQTAHAVGECLECARLEHADGTHSLRCRVPAATTDAVPRARALVGSTVVVLDPELAAHAALETLDRAGVPWAPVLDDNGVLVGLAAVHRLRALSNDAEAEVEDSLEAVLAVNEHASLAEVAHTMLKTGLERLPVVDDEGKLVGLVAAIDVMRWLVQRDATH